MSTDDKLTPLQQTEQELNQSSATLSVDPLISTSTPEQLSDAPHSSAFVDSITPTVTNGSKGEGAEEGTVKVEIPEGAEEARPSPSTDQLEISPDGHSDAAEGTTLLAQHIEDTPVVNGYLATRSSTPAAEDAPAVESSHVVDVASEGKDMVGSSISSAAPLVVSTAALPTSASAPIATSPSAISPPATAAVATTSATLPSAPVRSSSPAIATKKFASSLSVNKKFLEKAGEKGKPEVKVAVARPTVAPVIAPVSTTHPRLLTGKISTGPTATLIAAQSNTAVNGWLKNAVAADSAAGGPRSVSVDTTRGGSYERGRGMSGMGFGMGLPGRGQGAAVWGSRSAGMGSVGLGMGGDFPTAAEAANAKVLRAAALAEQIQARDRAIQVRAAAAAAANAHLLEGLDAFRGVHLDPNASHWDEMGDEDTDFLDDTIEFGDGTQYKIDADTVVHPSSSYINSGDLNEPDPSDSATLEAPLSAGESQEEPSREERFKDDYDRSWSKAPVEDSKNLFNDRLGKLEAYTGLRKVPAGILAHPPPEDSSTPRRLSTSDNHPHLDQRTRRASFTSPRMSQATLPANVRRDGSDGRAWGRDGASGSGENSRRPRTEETARADSATGRRPSLDQGGRQLPPHLAGLPAPTRDNHHDSAPHKVNPSQHQSQQSPPARPRLPSLSAVANSLSKPIESPSIAIPTPTAAAPEPLTDIEAVYSREMHAAAERAKKRRQEEELVRTEQMERARKKASELEEKARLAAEAAAALKAPRIPVTAVVSPTDAANAAAPVERLNSWRERPKIFAATPAPIVVPFIPIPIVVEPTRILVREAKVVESTIPTVAPVGIARQDQTWKRAALPSATNAKQLPPHLTSAVTASGLDLPTATLESSSPIILKQNSDSAEALASRAIKKAPMYSTLDDVMSRIKGAMSIPAPSLPVEDLAETISRPLTASPSATPKVKLPNSSSSPATITALPALVIQKSLAPTLPVPVKIIGRRIVKPATPPLPTFVNRDPLPLFDVTQQDRPQSPPPAWRVIPVSLGAYPILQPPSSKRLKTYANNQTPHNVETLSWTPPIAKLANSPRMSRDDMLLPERYVKGNPSHPVVLPKKRIGRRNTIVVLPPPVILAKSTETVVIEGSLAPKLDTLLAPVDSLPVPSPSQPPTVIGSTTVPHLHAVVPLETPSSSLKSIVATTGAAQRLEGSDGSASRFLERPRSSRPFMVTSQLGGEVVAMSPRESLAAPGAESQASPTELSSAHPKAISSLPDGGVSIPTSTWPAPLSLSVLDPTLPSLWSGALSELPVHARSTSLSGVKQENSLHGIADDDQPAIPTSLSELADLKSEDESGNEEKLAPAQAAKDEARLRAVAPAFSSHQSYPGVNLAPSREYLSSSFSRQPPHLPFPHSPNEYSSQSYQPSHQSQQYSSPQQPQQHLYSSYTVPGQTVPSYSMQPYSQGSYSPISASAVPPQMYGSYRAPTISNPALLAQGYNSSYGAVGSVSYGAVGGGGGGMNGNINGGANPMNRGSSAFSRGGYLGMTGYRVGEGSPSLIGAQPDARGYRGGNGGYPYSSGSPSTAPMPQHISQSYLPQQPQYSHSQPSNSYGAPYLPSSNGRSAQGGVLGQRPPVYRNEPSGSWL